MMDTVYILQIVTICITAFTLVINVLITIMTNKQKNYNEVITNNRVEFMLRNRDNAANFVAEAKNAALLLKRGVTAIELKPLYKYFEQLGISLKTYNSIDSEIVEAGKRVINLIEESMSAEKTEADLFAAIDGFSHLFNIYDDADWKFIKQQFNSTNRQSKDFDKICEEIKLKY